MRKQIDHITLQHFILWAMMQSIAATEPLVSVVTPFYNTETCLAQCIESVLAQSCSDFEYILMDNCSTDGSAEIAENYARRDSRIRFIRSSEFVPQLANYNRALTAISSASRYCKIVQADDYIYPECLELMVQAFGQSETIGLVSSYRLVGDVVQGSGYPHGRAMMHGRECAQWFLRTENNIFGSQTTVMYKSSLIRSVPRFYNESFHYSDLDVCIFILKHHDFGFVYKILSFSRVSDTSITASIERFHPYVLDRYLLACRYASEFLTDNEAALVKREFRRRYYRVLARTSISGRNRAFWRYHQEAMKAANETLDQGYLAFQIGLELLWLASNPGTTMAHVLRSWARRSKTRAARTR